MKLSSGALVAAPLFAVTVPVKELIVLETRFFSACQNSSLWVRRNGRWLNVYRASASSRANPAR